MSLDFFILALEKIISMHEETRLALAQYSAAMKGYNCGKKKVTLRLVRKSSN